MKIKLLAFFSLLLAIVMHGQTIRYIYETSVNPDSINLVRMKNERTFLDIKGDKSLFISENKLLKDSLLTTFKLENKENRKKEDRDFAKQGIRKQFEPTFFEYYITKSISGQKVYYHDKVGGKQIYYQEDRPLKWEITNTKDNQNGYPAQKAVVSFGGRVWTAWFTKDISISDGPYKFYGLPGLIVKLEDDKGDYKFDLVKKISIQNSFEEVMSTDAKESTRRGFQGDEAAIKLEMVKNRRLPTGIEKEGMNPGGGRHRGGMGDGRGMSHGVNKEGTFTVPEAGSGNNTLPNNISQNPIELK